MAIVPPFGQREAIQALKLLGFTVTTTGGKGSHAKAKHSTKIPSKDTYQRPLLTIPHRREFGSIARKAFIKQVTAFGFTPDEVVQALHGKKKK